MSSNKVSLTKVFLVFAIIRTSVTHASISSSAITTSPVTTPQSISSNSTTSIPSASSTPGPRGPTSNVSTAPPTGGAPSGGPTAPAQNVSNPFTIPWHLIYQFTNPPTTTTPPPTTIPTTPDPCVFAKRPTNMDKCANESCALKVLKDMEFYISCEKSGSENYYKHPTSLPNTGEMLALKISEDIKEKLLTNQPVNDTVVIVTDQLGIGASTIDSSMYTNVSRGMMAFPNISIHGTKEKLGKRADNRILYPKEDLPIQSGFVQVAWSISEAWKTKVPNDEIEPFRDIVWRLPVADMKVINNKILVNKEKPDLTINSPVITFSLQPKPQTPLENPFLIEFKRMKSDGVRYHRCYFWSETSSSSGFWSSIGSSAVSSNDTHTVCSYNHMSTFVVLSEIHAESDDAANTAVRIVAIVFCVLSIVALGATIRMTKKLGCMDNDRVNIHIHLCVILIIGYIFFIIGAIKSDVKVLNDILVTVLHFCQLSPFVWLFLEAVYFINTIWPIFDYRNTDARKFYISLGWALTAAFAGATAGFDFPHNGKPLASEIVWVFIDKVSCGYYFGPFLAFFLINIVLRVGLVIRVTISPEKCNSEKVPLRVKVNLLTTALLSAVVFLAWYMGVQAVNNTETKGYHFGFIVLYCFQAFLVFVIYGWQNEEMWSLHNKRKDEERKVEERKVTFTYVP